MLLRGQFYRAICDSPVTENYIALEEKGDVKYSHKYSNGKSKGVTLRDYDSSIDGLQMSL